MKKTIYLAGKVSGISRLEVVEKFGMMQIQLEKEGYKVINPLQIVPPDADWATAMKECIKVLMDCDEAYFMPCWADSIGASIEYNLCVDLEIPFHKNSF